jgi:hypothetical protein
MDLAEWIDALQLKMEGMIGGILAKVWRFELGYYSFRALQWCFFLDVLYFRLQTECICAAFPSTSQKQ